MRDRKPGHFLSDEPELFSIKKMLDVLCIYGEITESIEMPNMDLRGLEKVTISFERINFCSWIGITKLDRWIRDNFTSAILVKVPFRVLQKLRVTTDFFDFYTLQSANVPFFNLSEKRIKTQKIDNFQETFSKERGDFFVDGSGNILAGKIDYFFRKQIADSEAKSEPVKSRAAENIRDSVQDNSKTLQIAPATFSTDLQDQTMFWVDYLYFLDDSITLCEGILQQILRDFAEKSLDYASLLDACSFFSPVMNLELLKRKILIKQDSLHVKEISKPLGMQIRSFSDNLGTGLGKFLQHLTTVDEIALEELTGVLERLILPMQGIEKEFPKIEDVGSAMGDCMMTIKIPSEIIAQLEKGNVEQLKPEKIKSIGILLGKNIHDEDITSKNWVGIVYRSVEKLAASIDRFVEIIQGIDALRQILEHRIKEMNYIENYLESYDESKGEKPEDWRQMAAGLIKLIKSQAATEQEKCANVFYLSVPKSREEKEKEMEQSANSANSAAS